MLTENEKEEVRYKIVELQRLLAQHNLQSTVDVHASDDYGQTILNITADSGFWRSSTEECNPSWGSSHTYIDTSNEVNVAWQSSESCAN